MFKRYKPLQLHPIYILVKEKVFKILIDIRKPTLQKQQKKNFSISLK